jgi:hypothetical protein
MTGRVRNRLLVACAALSGIAAGVVGVQLPDPYWPMGLVLLVLLTCAAWGVVALILGRQN